MNITKSILEKGYVIHNNTQISVEVNEMIYLFTVEDTEQFIIDNGLQNE